MPYSLVSAATLGFDLVRLPGGRLVADVLLTGLGADAAALRQLAAHAPRRTAPPQERAALAGRSRRARELAATGVPQLRSTAAGGDGDRTTALVAQLERGMIGAAPALERLLRDDVLGPESAGAAELSAGPDADDLTAAADVLADAAVGAWAAQVLPPDVRRELTGPFTAATALAPPPVHELGPASGGLQDLLAALRDLDATGRARWRAVVDEVRASRRPWAAAMHEASWAGHVSGRTRALASAQLLAVQAFGDGGLDALDGAQGVWNAVAGCVQALAVADLLGEEALAVLTAPWPLVTGEPLALPG